MGQGLEDGKRSQQWVMDEAPFLKALRSAVTKYTENWISCRTPTSVLPMFFMANFILLENQS